MSKQSKSEPDGRQFSREFGYHPELEWFFNNSGSELGEHGSSWHEFLGAVEPNTESSDLVVGWGKCLVSSPEKYRRVVIAFRLLPPLQLDILAARYKPISAPGEVGANANSAAWNARLTQELKWVSVVVAMHLDRQIADENARLQEALSEIEFKSRKLRVAGNLDELFRAVEFGDTNQQMRLAGRKWRTKAERASRDAHAMYERARQFGQRPSYDEYWVQTGTVCPTPRHELPNVLPYASLLRLWESELMPVTQEAAPERSTRQRPPRASKPRSIEIRRGVEWALI